ncbi:2'-5' RNA ligase family protein [Clostridium tunisiense]|uniref:2'-5' RNA ligase family protein n=1 Tax=Clostridium tunisiense TaxID=219748 RepID=UPI0002F5BFCD|nr:2'-5' RNA ligase family protein [Clostridium tunisiense]
MRYVIVSVLKGAPGEFNNKLRKEVFKEFGAKSSKLPAHFTIKAPFEYEDELGELEKALENFCQKEKKEPFEIKGFDHFDNRVIFMRVNMSKAAKAVHDRLIDELSKINYINFDKKDGKNKVFHITVSSKRIQSVFKELWEYVNNLSCDFSGEFDNISIYKWSNDTWVLHKEYHLK